MDSKVLFSIDSILGGYVRESRYNIDQPLGISNQALSLSNSFSSTSSSGSPRNNASNGDGKPVNFTTNTKDMKTDIIYPTDTIKKNCPMDSSDTASINVKNPNQIEVHQWPPLGNGKTHSGNPASNEDMAMCVDTYSPKLNKYRSMMNQALVGRSPRVPFTRNQVNMLETKFRSTHYLSSLEVTELAHVLQLTETRVKIWFQNRRARERRENAVRSLNENDPHHNSSSSNDLPPVPNHLPASLASMFPVNTAQASSLFNTLSQTRDCSALMGMGLDRLIWPSNDALASSLVDPALTPSNGSQIQVEDEKA